MVAHKMNDKYYVTFQREYSAEITCKEFEEIAKTGIEINTPADLSYKFTERTPIRLFSECAKRIMRKNSLFIVGLQCKKTLLDEDIEVTKRLLKYVNEEKAVERETQRKLFDYCLN